MNDDEKDAFDFVMSVYGKICARLADRSGSYLMDSKGRLHTGTFSEIEELRRMQEVEQ
jgi:hypothetical protein